MGDPSGFINIKRKAAQYRPVCERVKDYAQVFLLPEPQHSQEQASRCMDCGTPFCNWACPVGNYIPEWNDFAFRNHWKKAFQLLDATNPLPEITGRVCPAPCEYSCVLGINDDPVSIRENELAIIEYAFKNGLIKPNIPKHRTKKKVAVVGSGPAGLSAAATLNKLGHKVIVFEKADKIGGILRYGIPDFKLEKSILDRRIDIFQKEGIEFRKSIDVGAKYPASELSSDFDAVCLATGSRAPRDLKIEGRDLDGIYFAMDYLTQANKVVAGEKISDEQLINAKNKKVVVIGGGDTGSDCVGTAHRQGASCVVQIEVLPKPSECRTQNCPWPKYPMILKTSTSHEEGGERKWAIATNKFIGENGKVKKLLCKEQQSNAEFEIEADMVILAVGFLHPEHDNLLTGLKIKFDPKGNISTDNNYMTSKKGVFCAGDSRRGQSLIVWAINEGRNCAFAMDKYLAKVK